MQNSVLGAIFQFGDAWREKEGPNVEKIYWSSVESQWFFLL